MIRCISLGLTVLLFAISYANANETINGSGSAWNKPDITILVGESVTWTWTGSHTSTSTTGNNCTASGLWNYLSSGQSRAFNSTGNNFYMCSFHCGMGMKGVVRVVDFDISCTPATVSTAQADSGTSTCTVTSLNGLVLPVTLSTSGLPSGVDASFNTNPVSPPANGTANSTLTLDVGASVAPGSYPFTLKAKATSGSSTPGNREKTFNMTLNVSAGMDFTVDCDPSTYSMLAGSNAGGVCTIDSIGGFSSNVDMACTGLPAGASCGFSVDPVDPPSNNSATTDLTVSADNTVAAGAYPFAVTGTGSPGTRSFSAQLVVQDFSVSSSPATMIGPPSGSAGGTTQITSLSGFNSEVTLGCTGLPSGALCDFSPPAITPDPNSSDTSTLLLTIDNSVAENTYPFQITGTSGGVTREFDASLVVTTAQDFSISCLPVTTSGNRNGTATTTCTISSVNSYNSEVTPGCQDLSSGITCDFDPAAVTPPQNGNAVTTLTLSIDAGTMLGEYPFLVTAADGTLSHDANVTVIVEPLYLDSFNDVDLSDWTFKKGSWSSSAGALTGSAERKGLAFAPHVMGVPGIVEADMLASGGDRNQISLYGWYKDNKNFVELILKPDSDRWILKFKINGNTVLKTKGIRTMDPGVSYHVALSYDGSAFHVTVDGDPVIDTNPAPLPPDGNPGFVVKAGSGIFGEILAYE